MVYKNQIIEALRELSDEGIQRRLWFASSNEVSSFTEVICRLYDDSGLDDALSRQERVFDQKTDEMLVEFSTRLDRVKRSLCSLAPAALIVHPNLEEIRRCALEIVTRITEGK